MVGVANLHLKPQPWTQLQDTAHRDSVGHQHWHQGPTRDGSPAAVPSTGSTVSLAAATRQPGNASPTVLHPPSPEMPAPHSQPHHPQSHSTVAA